MCTCTRIAHDVVCDCTACEHPGTCVASGRPLELTPGGYPRQENAPRASCMVQATRDRSLLLACLLGSASAFSLHLVAPAVRHCLSAPLPGIALVAPLQRAAICACAEKPKKDLVTEDMAVAAIEKAEALWAEALAARQKADALSAEAEELSAETAVESEGMNEKLSGEGTKFSLSMIGDARVVMDTAIDAQKLITDAVAAAELADQLEADAEIALQVSEAMLAEHERDFPE